MINYSELVSEQGHQIDDLLCKKKILIHALEDVRDIIFQENGTAAMGWKCLEIIKNSLDVCKN